ncbi:acetyl/propionyl/methylcrotonyl-CoA carboxylase subunit alpha [Phenylobacterium sp.]|uniref:acetyl-CoA carboxylase biotin carboxylase subunit n=1 Tax=Phenylobacterium sp. TaxID=1871053 RepID=UPI00199EC330|nr:acetyl/propionyl/methylcrotonyl-CoA carboxylase subunit alpha [Phenylobacterium sp.]MBC7168598.1 acetyl/propionyl/methylcrotonyl-CoA carboxylase subunit alpha [Phenylobacterium sp.]
MFKKILIANRGEIACRVIKSARKMGIATVAVYSDADRDALHVQMADEAVAIGPAPSAQSYLVMDRIVQACKDTGAEAVHPGYGFLSENKAFQQALAAEGIAFIGPDAWAIEAMGDKITSKKLAAEAGVSTVPGFMGIIKDAEEAVTIASEIGFPVMIKASAGGGGKGMRVAWNADEARDGFERATSEARSSFGDDRVFIEKFIEQPRHIEIQVLSDGENCIYLAERECSIQRRHQKVIEEAPSPFLDEATRKAMGEQAVALAKAVDYKSAGTVEFIVDAHRNFYFLEMNTRLQVEHPVTELITGLDLVDWMIKIAAGQKLTVQQADVKIKGWALESRIYAEDPYRNFLPSTGRLVRYMPPKDSDTVRVDTGVYEGGEISMFYDPMIAKLITYGIDRNLAIKHMRTALDEFYIRGVSHNIPFLASLLGKQRFVDGKLTTNFIAEEYPDGFHATDLPPEDPTVLVCVAASLHHLAVSREAQISGQMGGHERRVGDSYVVKLGKDDYHEITIRADAKRGGWLVHAGGRDHSVESAWTFGQPLWEGKVDGHALVVQVDRKGIGYELFHQGAVARVVVLEPIAATLDALMPVKLPPDMSKYLLSPMPGLLVSVEVSEGQEVKSGEKLAVVEAMKMENVLRAEQDGTVKTIHAEAGGSLSVDQIIIEFE